MPVARRVETSQGKGAGSLQTAGRVLLAQAEYGQAGIVALLFDTDSGEDAVNHLAGGRPHCFCPLADALVIPFHVLELVRHVLRNRCPLVGKILREPVMHGNPFTFVVDFHQRVRNPQVNLLANILVRAGVVVFVQHDVAVQIDRTVVLPGGNLVGNCRQRT